MLVLVAVSRVYPWPFYSPIPNSAFLTQLKKKIKVVTAVAEELGLKNVTPLRKRAEEEKGKYQFIISRAVTEFPAFVKLTAKNIDSRENISPGNGIICLKGGDLSQELSLFQKKVKVWEIKDFFKEPFFESKKIIYLEN
jgi:16S rRNA (guanine527-N7)-methyltransferase